jgi:hypothetical protein
MFAIPSLSKILLVAIVIAGVWWFFRRNDAKARADRERAQSGTRRRDAKSSEKHIEDMVQCAKCGAYVPIGSAHCGKEGCPF